jgi:hypothetical protein
MKLIYTNDGLIGLEFDKHSNVIWCHTIEEATNLMHANFQRMHEPPTKQEIEKDIRYAVDHMARTGDTIAEFGVFGTFMFTTTEPEYEF